MLEITVTAYLPSGEPSEVEQLQRIVDHAGYLCKINLSYPPEYAQKYKELFNLVVQTFKIVQ